MPVFNRLQHIVVAVKDLDAAAADWEKIFAFKATNRSEDAESRRVQFNVGGSWIALAEPVTEKGPLREFLETRGQGVCSAAVQVEDVETVVKRVQEQGASVHRDGSGRVSVDPQFTTGVRIELWPAGPQSDGPSLFKRFHHLVVATNGTAAAADAWHNLFSPQGAADPSRGSFTGQVTAGQAYFGLIDSEDHPEPVKKFLTEKGEGVYIVSVVDDNVVGTIQAVRERGGRIVGDENGGGQVFVHPVSTHGVLLEINDEEYTRNWVVDYGKAPNQR